MSSSPSKCFEEEIRAFARSLGAAACGFVRTEAVEPEAVDVYQRWLDAGRQGTMDYCERYLDVRSDPRLLLPGARSMVVCAFPYFSGKPYADADHHPRIARYALGADYHYVLRERLAHLSDFITSRVGGDTLPCIDTKPLRERYWAQRAGVGFIGRNNQLIVPGVGSYVFLATLLTTAELMPDEPCRLSCEGCGTCLRACPNQALKLDGSCDTSRCISYLTIEHKGAVPESLRLAGYICGCDICQEVCPHNRTNDPRKTPLSEFMPREELLTLTREQLASMGSSAWKRLTRGSPLARVRNIKSKI